MRGIFIYGWKWGREYSIFVIIRGGGLRGCVLGISIICYSERFFSDKI